MLRHRKKAFTLVEIMVVASIIMIMAALVSKSVVNARLLAQDAYMHKYLRSFIDACNQYYLNNSRYPSTLSEITQANPPYFRMSPEPVEMFAGFYVSEYPIERTNYYLGIRILPPAFLEVVAAWGGVINPPHPAIRMNASTMSITYE